MKDSSRIKKAREHYTKHYKDDLNIGSNKIDTNDINDTNLKECIGLVKKFIKANNNVELQDGRSLSKRVSWGWLNVGEKEFKIHLKAYRDANSAHKAFLSGIAIYDTASFLKKITKKLPEKFKRKMRKKFKKFKNMHESFNITI